MCRFQISCVQGKYRMLGTGICQSSHQNIIPDKLFKILELQQITLTCISSGHQNTSQVWMPPIKCMHLFWWWWWRWFERLLCGSSSMWMLVASNSVLGCEPCMESFARHQPGNLSHVSWIPRTVGHQNWPMVRSMELSRLVLLVWHEWQLNHLILTSSRSSQLPCRSLCGVLSEASKWISEKVGTTLHYVYYRWFQLPDLCNTHSQILALETKQNRVKKS